MSYPIHSRECFRPAQNWYAHIRMVKGNMVFEQGGGGVYRATPAVTHDLGFCSLIQGSTQLGRLSRQSLFPLNYLLYEVENKV